MSSVEDLTTPLTVDEIKGAIYAVISRTGATTTNWKPGAIVRTLITAVAIVLSGFSALIALLARSAFLQLATGEWLRLVAYYVYNVIRIEATFATGKLTLTNAGGGVFTAAAGAFSARNPTTKQLYTNLSLFTLGSGETLTIDIASLEAGAQSTSYSGEITEMVTAWTAVTCSNDSPVIGYDVESDAQLRVRCTDKLGALSPNGPADAYRYVARSAKRADGSPIGITRVRSLPAGNGTVLTYLAGASGAILGSVGDLTSDLGIVDDQLQRSCVPLCVTLSTFSAAVVPVAINYRVWLYNTSGMTVDEIATAISAEVSDYFANMPIGGDIIDVSGFVYRSELEAVIGRARKPDGSPLRIVRVELIDPIADIPLTTGQVPALGSVSSSISQISAVGI